MWREAGALGARMFALDARLSAEARNWNHNLAHIFRVGARIRAKKPERWASFESKFDSQDWILRGSHAMREIRALDAELADAIQRFLDRV